MSNGDVTTRKRDTMRGKPIRAVLAGLALAVGLVGCGHAGTTVAEPTAGVSATSQTMSGHDLAALWDSPKSEPCAEPAPLYGDALQPVADSLKDMPSVDSVKETLITVTATGPYIMDDLHNLHAALLQTRYDMVTLGDRDGIDSSQVREARDFFAQYLAAVVNDLQSGSTPTPLADYEFRMEDTCG